MKMEYYSVLTLGNLLDWVTAQPADTVIHLDPNLSSYRGYYEHVSFGEGETTAGRLTEAIKDKLGGSMYGYKGGHFPIHRGCLVFLAEYGETGPALIGFTSEGYPMGVELPFLF